MNRYEYRECIDYAPIVGKKSVVGTHGKIGNVLTTAPRLCRLTLCTITLVTAVGASADGWQVNEPQAASPARPLLTLSLTGTNDTQAGQSLDGIVVRLSNPGPSTQASHLRLTIHDGENRELGADDIKIDVREENAWNEVKSEVIDGGVMGVIGKKGNPHENGGFTVVAKVNKVWRLRVIFRLPGHYALVVAVSSGNGETQLAQPANLNVEVL